MGARRRSGGRSAAGGWMAQMSSYCDFAVSAVNRQDAKSPRCRILDLGVLGALAVTSLVVIVSTRAACCWSIVSSSRILVEELIPNWEDHRSHRRDRRD